MSRRTRFLKSARDAVFAFLGVSAIGIAFYVYLHDSANRPVLLRMSAGRNIGERSRIAEVLKNEASSRSVDLSLVETAGSDAALDDLNAGRLDLALVQGALDLRDRPNLRQVATLHVEPLHLLVKEELHADICVRLSALRGKVIGIGEVGSGTHRLASEVLSFAGLRPGSKQDPNTFQPDVSGYATYQSESDRERLPDAIFMVSTLPSPIARHLVLVHRYRLVPLPFQEAFTLGAVDQVPRTASGATGIERRHVQKAVIPAFAYEVEPGVPPQTMETLGTRLLLVAHKNVSSRSIVRLLDVVYTSRFGQAIRPPLELKLLEIPSELPWHEGTESFLHRNAPIIAGDVVDLLEKELSIAGAMVGAAYFLTQWLRRRVRRLRDRGFEAYMLRVNKIERQAIVLERSVTLDLGQLVRLQEDLSNLKGEALDKFVEGELDGEEMMSGFLTHVSDTRDFLTRLILHARAHTEEMVRLGDLAAQPESIVA